MLRILWLALPAALAGCSLIPSHPTQTQLGQCIAQAQFGNILAIETLTLGQMIEVAEANGSQIGWRTMGEGRYVLTLIKKSSLTSGTGKAMLELHEEPQDKPPAGCAQPSLVVRGISANGQMLDPLIAQSFLFAMLESWRKTHPKSAQLAPTEPMSMAPAVDALPSASAISPAVGRLLDPAMLDATVAYFEEAAGPPYSIDGNVRIYKVDAARW